MNKSICALLLAGLMTASLCACHSDTIEQETQLPSPEPTVLPTEDTEVTEVFRAFLRGESKAVVDEDFYNELYDSGLADMESFTIRELFKSLHEMDAGAGGGNLTYTVVETQGGREMLALYYVPTGAANSHLYLIFGVFNGQVRLTYGTEFGYRSDVELYQGLVFFHAGSAGAGDHYAWGGYINEDGHYQKVYEMEILNDEWIVMDAREAFDMEDADWDWNWANNCVCYLLTTDEGSYYELDTMDGVELTDIDPKQLALLRKHYQDRGLTEVEDADAVIAEAEAAYGIRETPVITDWTQISMPIVGTPVEAYQQALERLLEEHISLDGYHIRDNEWDVEDFLFAIKDVDMDGDLELIAQIGRNTHVYGYDRERADLVLELVGGIRCRFYDNAMAQLDSNHQTNGLAGRFWPYGVSKYEEETGKYRNIGSVDAFDLEIMKEVGAESIYPQEIDVEGAGFVYFVTRDGEKATMSQAEYDTWYQDAFGGAEEIEVNYQPLTVANIGNLICEGVKPKVVVRVDNKWLNYDIRDYGASGFGLVRLSKRQNDLLKDLPVDQLPREAAKTWSRGDIWEDTLLPMCYDEKNDFTVYAVVTEESVQSRQEHGGYLAGSGILVRQGEDTNYLPIEHDQFWTGENPMIVVKDFDGDGGDEIAVSFFAAHGTGVGVEVLYIFDPTRLWYDYTVDFSRVNIDVSYDEKTNRATLTSGGEQVSVTIPDGVEFDGVYAGEQVHYRYEDGKLLCALDLDFSGLGVGYVARAIGEVVYEGGWYTLGPLKLELN